MTAVPTAAAIGRALVEGLLEFPARVGVGHDAAAGTEPHAAAGQLQGADGDVELEAGDRAGEADRAGVDLAAGGLELGDDAQRLHLGRAGDRAWRKGRAQDVSVAHAVPQPPVDVGHQVPEPGVGLGGGLPRGDDRAVLAHATQVVAHEVDDHHVLGGVLDRAAQMHERRGGRRRVGAPRDRALDGAGHDAPAPPAQEELGRQGGDPAAGGVKRGGVGWRDVLERGGEHVGGPGVGLAVQAQADIGLEDLAGRDPPTALRDRVEVVRGVVRGQSHRRDLRVREARGFAAQELSQVGQAGSEPRATVVGDERLEPPPPVGVAAQHVVVVGQVEVRERHGPVGVQRDALDPGGEAVAKPPEPATPDRARRRRLRRRHGRHGVEHGERVLVIAGDAQRVRAHDGATAGLVGPSSGQRERQRLALRQDAEDLRGGQPTVKRDARQRGRGR